MLVAFFTFLAYGSEKESPKDKAKREQAAAAASKDVFPKVSRLYGMMANVYNAAVTFDEKHRDKLECRPQLIEAFLKSHTEKHPNRNGYMALYYAPLLKRDLRKVVENFKDAAPQIPEALPIKKNNSGVRTEVDPWGWLTSAYHFSSETEFPKDHYDLNDGLERIEDAIPEQGYVAVLKPAVGEAPVMPKDGVNNAFTKGWFKGSLMIVRVKDAQVVCQGSTGVVESSKTVKFVENGRGIVGKLREKTPDEALRDDFQDNMYTALAKVLPKGIRLDVSFGPLFR